MRLRTLLTTTALTAAAIAATALPASAGSICYDLHAETNGDVLVSESGCEELPL